MSRKIDTSKPLSEEDRLYLVRRMRYRTIAEAERTAARQTAAQPTQTPTGQPDSNRGSVTPEPPDKPYEEWTVAELHTELDRRLKIEDLTDEERENLAYKANEKKADLIARLEKDDEAAEDEDDSDS